MTQTAEGEAGGEGLEPGLGDTGSAIPNPSAPPDFGHFGLRPIFLSFAGARRGAVAWPLGAAPPQAWPLRLARPS